MKNKYSDLIDQTFEFPQDEFHTEDNELYFHNIPLMEIIKQCQYIAINAGCPSVMSYVKIAYKPEGEVLTIEEKTTKHHI